jgi:gamma-glutamylputrescine oxidase
MEKLPHAKSYYAGTANPSDARLTLTQDIDADVCIIGAGYTGLSSAIALTEAGFKVVILEKNDIGWGASGRNGGQIVHSYSRDINVIEKNYGEKIAKPLGDMMFEGSSVIRNYIKKYEIQCDLKTGGIYAATSARKFHELKETKLLWEKWGNQNLRLIEDKEEIKKYVNSDLYVGIMIDESGGHFHALNLALGEAAAVEKNGGKIFIGSGVTKIERGNPAIVRTEKGSVRAKYVIVACNAYGEDLEPQLSAKSMPCGTQVIATEPLGDLGKKLIPSDCCVEDNNFLLDYFRLTGDGRMLFGGGVIYGARDPAHIESIIVPKMIRVFPQLKDVNVDFAWTGNFLLTLSRLPQVGNLSNNIYYSQGCSGHGITYTHLIGQVLCEAIQGDTYRFDSFSCLVHHPFPGGRAMRIPFTAIGAMWYGLRDKIGV